MDTECKQLWEKLRDIPINDDEEIEIPFETPYGTFPAGTHRFDVWHWFEKKFNCMIGKLQNGGYEK